MGDGQMEVESTMIEWRELRPYDRRWPYRTGYPCAGPVLVTEIPGVVLVVYRCSDIEWRSHTYYADPPEFVKASLEVKGAAMARTLAIAAAAKRMRATMLSAQRLARRRFQSFRVSKGPFPGCLCRDCLPTTKPLDAAAQCCTVMADVRREKDDLPLLDRRRR